jgi:hypothetical protein
MEPRSATFEARASRILGKPLPLDDVSFVTRKGREGLCASVRRLHNRTGFGLRAPRAEKNDAPFSIYDDHGLRQLWQAHADAMRSLQKLRFFRESEKAAMSNRVVDNLSAAYDSGLRDSSALARAALRGFDHPRNSS